MKNIINPLFAPKPAKPTEVLSGIQDTVAAPSSPISGHPMVTAFCHKIPVYVDMDNRVVIPMRQNPNG